MACSSLDWRADESGFHKPGRSLSDISDRMKVQYTTRERLYGLLMLSLIVCGIITMAAMPELLPMSQFTIHKGNNFTEVISPLFAGIAFFASMLLPVAIVCLIVGMPTRWIGQRLGFSSYLAAFVWGVIALTLLLFCLSGFDFSFFTTALKHQDRSWSVYQGLVGGPCGLVARFFAERARQKNIGSL